MKKILAVVAVFIALNAMPVSSFAEDEPEDFFYYQSNYDRYEPGDYILLWLIGLRELPWSFGFGTGKLFINGKSIEDIYKNNTDYTVSDGYYFTLGTSGKVNPFVHMGVEGTFFTQSAKPKLETQPKFDHQAYSIIISGSYFPRATGLFFKAGLGGAGMDTVTRSSDPAVGDDHNYYWGRTVLGGVGYDIVGERFHIGVYGEYSKQFYDEKYDEEGVLEESDFDSDLVTLYVKVGWY